MYVLPMTDLQRDFYSTLLAPFHDHELSEVAGRGSKTLTYIDKRALENRLDTVCGPAGWRPEYRFENGVCVCRLSILTPGHEAKAGGVHSFFTGCFWVSKEDGGANEGMAKKVSGEIVEGTDNDAKGFFTNALRLAAQDAWVIGRHLYEKSVPLRLDLENAPLRSTPVARAGTAAGKYLTLPYPLPEEGRGRIDRSRSRSAEVYQAPTPQPAGPTEAPEPTDQPIQSSRGGEPVWTWAKRMRSTYGTHLTHEVIDGARALDPGDWSNTWDSTVTRPVCLDLIAYLMTTPGYQSRFGNLAYVVSGHSGIGCTRTGSPEHRRAPLSWLMKPRSFVTRRHTKH
jgi:hypothetical protein